MTEELHALTPQGMMGRVQWDRGRDRPAFIYEEAWRANTASYPLSLSMPLAAAAHEVRMDFEVLRARILHLARALPDTARTVGAAVRSEGISYNVIDRLVDALAERAIYCQTAMGE